MTWSVVWTLLPNGFVGADRLALSLVAAPRVEDGADTLDGSPLADWPGVVDDLLPLRVVSDDGAVDVPATLVDPSPDPGAWSNLFPPGSPVAPAGPKAAELPSVIGGPSVSEAAREIDALFASFVAASPHRWPAAADDVVAPLRALASPMRPTFATRAERVAAATRLDRAGDRAGTATLAIGHVADHLRGRSTGRPRDIGRRDVGGPDPVAAIGRIDEVDVHQVFGLVLAHPMLARRLGLRLDLTIPVFTGPRTIRVVGADGTPPDGPVRRRQPWSRVVSDVSTRRFVMLPQPGASTEIVDGMLDLTGAGAAGPAVVSTTDVVGVSLQLDAIARSRLAPDGIRAIEPVPLPVLRDAGFTVSRPDRGVIVAGHAMQRAQVLDPTAGGPDTVLFADDVTTGYRLDVAVDGGPFRSLMRRRSTYTVGATTFAGDEEGRVEALPVLADSAGRDAAVLLAGEDVVSWDGWSLGVPRPGPAVLGDAPNAPTTVVVTGEVAPGFDLRHDVALVHGTLPRLRFGRSYELQARAVDLAGNSVPTNGDRDHAIDAGPYLRREILPSPEVVPRRRFSFGESHVHLVVRSDGRGGRPGPDCERHLVLPKAPQALAETHGMFDEAFGPGVPADVRDRVLRVASREAGTFIDPTVPGPGGTPIPTPGFSIVTNDPTVVPRVRLPLTPGEPLPNGAYAVHDTDRMVTPYLADPLAGGVSLLGVPGQQGPVVVPATGAAWPDLVPTRLVVRGVTAGGPSQVGATPSAAGQVLTLDVPPATKVDIELACTADAGMLDQVDLLGHELADLLDGTAITRCARQTVTIVHAVEQPLADPTLTGPGAVPAGPDATAIDVTASVGYHPASTGEVHVLAEWDDPIDTGSGPVETRRRTATLGSTIVVGPEGVLGSGAAALSFTHELGDRRRHDVVLTPVATSPFREYFDPGTVATRSGQPATLTVKNRTRPPSPVVHSVVPLFRWTRTPGSGTYTSLRETVGVRVLLDRPWNVTGSGERLGVVVYRTSSGASSVGGKLLRELVTRWGTDPLQELQPQATEHLLANRFGGHSDLAAGVTIPDFPPSAGSVTVPKVDVVAYPVQFDAARDRWFADVQFSVIGLPEQSWPFLRLALVRLQPESVTGSHLSPVTIAPFVQVPPPRFLQAQRAGEVGVKVKLTGTPVANSRFTVRQERRIPEPSIPTLDLGVDATSGWKVTPGGGPGLANLVLEPIGNRPPNDVLAELLAGRVVVEEIESGRALRHDVPAERVVFTETFDRTTVGMQGVS